jgi:hypothetical protein
MAPAGIKYGALARADGLSFFTRSSRPKRALRLNRRVPEIHGANQRALRRAAGRFRPDRGWGIRLLMRRASGRSNPRRTVRRDFQQRGTSFVDGRGLRPSSIYCARLTGSAPRRHRSRGARQGVLHDESLPEVPCFVPGFLHCAQRRDRFRRATVTDTRRSAPLRRRAGLCGHTDPGVVRAARTIVTLPVTSGAP